MNLEQFLRNRSSAWRELEGYISRFDLPRDKGLDGAALAEMGDLYREVTRNLAYLSTHYPVIPETVYLTRLAAMAHAMLYYIPTLPLARLWPFCPKCFPVTFR